MKSDKTNDILQHGLFIGLITFFFGIYINFRLEWEWAFFMRFTGYSILIFLITLIAAFIYNGLYGERITVSDGPGPPPREDGK